MDIATAQKLTGAAEAITLVGHKLTNAYEIWVWADATGQGYVTKKETSARPAYGWKLVAPHWRAESFMKNNGTIGRVAGSPPSGDGPGDGNDYDFTNLGQGGRFD